MYSMALVGVRQKAGQSVRSLQSSQGTRERIIGLGGEKWAELSLSLLSFLVLPLFCPYACLYGKILEFFVKKPVKCVLGVKGCPAFILAKPSLFRFQCLSVSSRTVGMGEQDSLPDSASPGFCCTRALPRSPVTKLLSLIKQMPAFLPGLLIYFILSFLLLPVILASL